MTATDRLLPVLVAIVYGACIVAAWGLTSLATDTDVIRYPDAGPLLGPAMGGAAVLVTLGWLLRVRGGARLRGSAVLAAVTCWAAMLVVGGVGYMLTRAAPAWLLLFAGDYAASPYLLVPAVLSALAVLATRALTGRSPAARSFDRR